jgi:hypothetical protein
MSCNSCTSFSAIISRWINEVHSYWRATFTASLALVNKSACSSCILLRSPSIPFRTEDNILTCSALSLNAIWGASLTPASFMWRMYPDFADGCDTLIRFGSIGA